MRELNQVNEINGGNLVIIKAFIKLIEKIVDAVFKNNPLDYTSCNHRTP